MDVARAEQSGTTAGVSHWPSELVSLLEEHHISAWSALTDERTRFTRSLATHLHSMIDTGACIIDGSAVHDLETFCLQLERSLKTPRIHRGVHTPGGIVDALREGTLVDGAGRSCKRLFYIWTDAHVLLREDPALFSQLVDAMLGVAAEAEYTSEDLLRIHRAVFVGAPSLDVYAEDETGQFRAWHSEADERPLWDVLTGVPAPAVLRYRIALDAA